MTFLASLFFGVGAGGWVYTKLAHRTGNANPSSTFGLAAVFGGIAFIFFFTLLKYVLHID
jgi:hypothetical protein